MGGTVDVTSVEGRGSTFAASLALEHHPDASAPAELRAPEGTTLALVAASPLVRDLVCEGLAAFGARVECHTDLEAARRVIAGRLREGDRFPAILVDHAFGEAECRSFAASVAAETADRRPTMVRLTAGHLADRNGSATGFDLDVAKPFLERRWIELLRRLSLLSEAADSVPSGRTEEEVLAGGRVLLVEDNRVNRTIAVRLLEKMGVEAKVAENGREALDAVAREDFDLVLMDCQMPVMDGYDATEEIRAREGATGRRVPIVALTASVRERDRERCLAVGMDDFLSKPFTVDQLRASVLRWLGDATPPVHENDR
jgi:CheY-like chemotaxis protein